MQDTYYIQSQARRIAKCIYPEEYKNFPVCPSYLTGLDTERFWKALGNLRQVFMDYYKQAQTAPASLQLPAYEIAAYRNTSAEAREGNAALLNFPCAVFALGMSGQRVNDGLQIDLSILRKSFSDLRCKYLTQQLAVLTDYGFVCDAFDGKALKKTGEIQVYYPDNPDVLSVLTALGDKLRKYMPYHLKQPKSGWGLGMLEQFVFLCPAIFADDSEQLPQKTLGHMGNVVGAEHRDLLNAAADRFAKRGLALKFDTAFLKNRFLNQKGKDSLCYLEYSDYRSIWKDGDEQLFLRLKLNHPDAYMDEIQALPSNLLKEFTEVWCGNCSENCNRRIVYHMDGEEKRACGCFFFAFRNPSEDDLDKLMNLYDLEQRANEKNSKR